MFVKVHELNRVDGTVSGILSNEPQTMTGVFYGDDIGFGLCDVMEVMIMNIETEEPVDWMQMLHDKELVCGEDSDEERLSEKSESGTWHKPYRKHYLN